MRAPGPKLCAPFWYRKILLKLEWLIFIFFEMSVLPEVKTIYSVWNGCISSRSFNVYLSNSVWSLSLITMIGFYLHNRLERFLLVDEDRIIDDLIYWTILYRRSWDRARSSISQVPPAFITANIAIGVHFDFPKQKGTIVSQPTPRYI